MNRKLMRTLSVLVILVMLLSGCNAADVMKTVEDSASTEVKAGQTISGDSKWINSDIDGAIDESTEVSLKDDYNTAVNRDWILATSPTNEDPSPSSFSGDADVLNERLLEIVSDTHADVSEESIEGLSVEQVGHDQDIVSDFAEIAGNWDTRSSAGVEPARKYVEAIANIESMDELNDYLLDKDGLNFTQSGLVTASVSRPFSDRDVNTVMISDAELSLTNQDYYSNMTSDAITRKNVNDRKVAYVLGRLGYSQSEIDRILKQCYGLEADLAAAMDEYDEQRSVEYLTEADNTYTIEQITEIQGNYPLTQILEAEGLGDSQRYTVCEPDYVEAVGRIYSENNLEGIKSYLLVGTANQLITLLDREAFNENKEIEAELNGTTYNSDDVDEQSVLLNEYMFQYLSEPTQQVYIARYCDPEDKASIKTLIEDVFAYYSEMLRSEDWLSEETKNQAVAKLDNMTVRVLYPDSFNDYSNLSFTAGENLVDAVAAVNDYQADIQASKVNASTADNEWLLSEMPTTQVNAMYSATDNSINILAGIVADGYFYQTDMTDEQKLARLGSVIGHEITHAFDSSGSQFDKDGINTDWWTSDDSTAFSAKVKDMQNYYSALIPYPGATPYTTDVTSEATADMGGVKAMLGLAENREGFDYDQFFREYAGVWKVQRSLDSERQYTYNDEHPLAFLRTNVTLQQFDKFYETYDIQPGDGMYVNPEDRILIW